MLTQTTVLRFWDRKFTKLSEFPGVVFEVRRLEWELQGGCSKAVVVARGKADRLAQLAQLLRCGVEIGSGWASIPWAGVPAAREWVQTWEWSWWGYVHAVKSQGLELSLDGMANRVAVRYRDVRLSELITSSWQYQTSWVQDNSSVAEYGKKEMVFSLQETLTAEANALAQTELAKRNRPVYRASGQLSAVSGQPEQEVTLELRGWFSTLGWTFFSEARGQLGFTGGGSSVNIGDTAATAFAESVTTGAAGWTAQALFFKVGKEGAPADNLYFDLYSNSGGAPNTQLARSTIAGPGLTGETNWIKGEFASAYALAASTQYWVKISRSGGADAANFYRVSLDQGLPFSGGTGLLWDGGAWAARVPDADMPFLLVGQMASTSQILTMADPTLGGGQFLAGVFVKDASTVQARLYRTGRETALAEVLAMLAMGNGSGGRLQGWVNRARVLAVEAVGSGASPELLIVNGSELRRRDGGPVSLATRLVGRWARVQDWTQAGGDAGPLGAVLITKAVWDAGDGKVRVGWE